MKDDERVYSIDDARDTLMRILGHISNCDTKASILLGITGIVLTAVVDLIFQGSATTAMRSELIICNPNYLMIATMLSFVVGLILLIFVLIPILKSPSTKSNIYFSDINKHNSAEKYKDIVKKQQDSDILDDLIEEIYINAKICSKKYTRFKWSVYSIGLGAILFAVATCMNAL